MGFEPKLILNLFTSSGSQSGMIVQINWKAMGATICKKKTKNKATKNRSLCCESET